MAGPPARFAFLFASFFLHYALAQDHDHVQDVDQQNHGPTTHVTSTKLPFQQLTQGSTPQGWMQMGTPPKWLKVIFDTGSDKLVAKTWSTISAELTQIDQGIDGMVMPTELLYDHNSSSSYVHKMMKDPVTGKEGNMMSMIAYGSGDAVTEEGTETVVVGAQQLKNFSLSEISTDSLQLLHTSKGIAGILGLQHMKNKSLGTSIFSKMREEKLLTSFGYCRGSNNTGTFIWGDDSQEGIEIPIIGQMHWAVTLQNVKVKDTDSSSLVAKGKKQLPRFPESGIRTSRHHQGHFHANKHAAHSRQAPFGGEGVGGGFGGPDMDRDDDSSGDGDGSDPFGNPFGMGGDTDGSDGGSMGGDGGMGGEGGGMGGGGEGGFPFGGSGFGDQMPDHEFEEGNSISDVIEMSKKHLCNDWNCTAILDTGSNIIAGPTKALKGIIAQINVKNDCSNLDKLPPLTFKLGGHPVTVHAESYVMKVQLPPGMDIGGDGDGDGAGHSSMGDPIFGGDGDGDGQGDGGDAQSDEGDAHDDVGGGDMADPSGGCGGGGGGGCGGGGGMGGLDTFSKERVGIAMPNSVHIGIPGNHGRRSINIEINRHDPQQQRPEGHGRSALKGESASLAQLSAKKAKHRRSITARWRAHLNHLKTHRGIDLITGLREMLQHDNGTEAKFLCMPALVPLDKHTPFGPLWIVGTPFLEEYYGRYSFDHDADSPKFNFKPLKEAETCKHLDANASSPLDSSSSELQESSGRPVSFRHGMMRSEQTSSSKPEKKAERVKKGPIIRTLDEIAFPHWAKSSLLKI